MKKYLLPSLPLPCVTRCYSGQTDAFAFVAGASTAVDERRVEAVDVEVHLAESEAWSEVATAADGSIAAVIGGEEESREEEST